MASSVSATVANFPVELAQRWPTVFFNCTEPELTLLRPLQEQGLPFTAYEQNISPQRLQANPEARIVSVSTQTRIDKALLSHAPQLKLLAIRQTGFSHVVLPELEQLGIAAFNCPDYCSQAVAEHVVLLMLSWARQVAPLYAQTATGNFTFPQTGFGLELKGKTLGLYGWGNTAKALVPIAKGLGMQVRFWSRSERRQQAAAYGVEQVSQEALLASSDFLSLHVPLNEETKGCINERSLARLKQGAVLINVARGALVATKDVLAALESGQLGAYLLDVLPNESYLLSAKRLQSTLLGAAMDKSTAQAILMEQTLLRHPRVLATPHIAFFTHEAATEQMRKTLEMLARFLNGEDQPYLINPPQKPAFEPA